MTNPDDWNQRKLNQSVQRLKDYQDLVWQKGTGGGAQAFICGGTGTFLGV